MADVIAEEQKQYDRRIHDSVTKNLSSVTENPPETVTKNYSAAHGPVSHSRASGAASALSLYASLLFDCASPTHLASSVSARFPAANVAAKRNPNAGKQP